MGVSFRDIIEISVALAAIAGFFFGLYQYRQAQTWKRLEFAAGQIQRLTSDPDLVLAITFLEYSKMEIPLPEKYAKIAKTDTFEHDSSQLSRMMEPDYFERTAEYFIYREAFMRLFEYLEQIYQFIDMKLIKATDVKGIAWVLRQIAQPRFIPQMILIEQLQSNFTDILKLMQIMGVRVKILDIAVRPARPTDLEQLCAIRHHPTLFEKYFQECDGKRAHFLVAEVDHKVAGFGLVYLDVTKTGKRKSHLPKLSDLYVAEPYRGQGIGSALIRARERLAREYGHAEIFVSIDPAESPAMIRLARRHGYRAMQSEPYPVTDTFYDENGTPFEKYYTRLDFRKALK